jgi:flagella basal body P-ring formation protein FlgA
MRLIPIIAGAAAFAIAAPADAAGFEDPAAIDVQVAQFTGAAIGVPGGARLPVDRRLKLARCAAPLAFDWYGARRDTVLVRCPEEGSWRIFVPVAVQAAAAGKAAVTRGDAVTIAIHGHGFTLSRQAEALEGGTVGDWVRVRPAGAAKADPIRARILRPGMVGMELP